MSSKRLLFLALFLTTPLAFAQWQWVDKDGHKVFSDKAPPPDVPAKNILRQPGMRSPATVPAEPAPVAPPAAVPKVSGKDKELEQRSKQAAAAEADKKKAHDEEVARVRADNCQRARQAKAEFDSGMRIVRMNDKGEREYLDDAQRATESRRIEGVIASDC